MLDHCQDTVAATPSDDDQHHGELDQAAIGARRTAAVGEAPLPRLPCAPDAALTAAVPLLRRRTRRELRGRLQLPRLVTRYAQFLRIAGCGSKACAEDVRASLRSGDKCCDEPGPYESRAVARGLRRLGRRGAEIVDLAHDVAEALDAFPGAAASGAPNSRSRAVGVGTARRLGISRRIGNGAAGAASSRRASARPPSAGGLVRSRRGGGAAGRGSRSSARWPYAPPRLRPCGSLLRAPGAPW